MTLDYGKGVWVQYPKYDLRMEGGKDQLDIIRFLKTGFRRCYSANEETSYTLRENICKFYVWWLSSNIHNDPLIVNNKNTNYSNWKLAKYLTRHFTKGKIQVVYKLMEKMVNLKSCDQDGGAGRPRAKALPMGMPKLLLLTE